MQNLKRIFFILTACLALALYPRPAPAATWDYTVSTTDTPTTIDTANTTAVVDTSNKEIKLPPLPATDIVSFWPSGEMDYAVLTTAGVKHYSYNGTTMVENTLLNVNISNPLALAAPDQYPDVVVADSSGIKHYSITGSAMVQNPALSVAGLSGIAAVGVAGQKDLAALIGSQVQHFTFNGTSMARNTVLEPSPALSNPIDVALGSGGYDTAVLEPDRVRWFNFNGSGTSENPALAVTGLTNPMAMAVANPDSGHDVAVVDGNQVKHYSFNGPSMIYNPTLSVTSGLNNPRAVAIQPGPGNYGRIIVDGNDVKFYAWNGSSLVYDPNRSVTVANIVQGVGYRGPATVTSKAFDPGANSGYVRVRAAHELPNNTSVTWSVTADGANWAKKWRVRGTSTGMVLETSPDNGVTWNPAGTDNDAFPAVNNAQLWTQVTAGRVVKFKADLATTDPTVTPRIASNPRGGVAVRLDTNAAPNSPSLPSYGTCFTTTTPTLTWTFSDPDAGDCESAYQIQIVRASDLSLIIDSGKLAGSQTSYTIPTSTASDVPGPLWNSGAYQFKCRVMVWDQAGAASPWSSWGDFCVTALERPRIARIVSPPAGQISPDPANTATHIVITPGMAALPKVKAGAKATLLVDSVGPLTSFSSAFPYLSQTSSVNTPAKLPDGVANNPLYPAGNPVNRWSVEFWTNPSLAVCPTGTLVQMRLSGNSGAGAANLNAPPYSEGIVVTAGSIYSDWFVVLQGRDTS